MVHLLCHAFSRLLVLVGAVLFIYIIGFGLFWHGLPKHSTAMVHHKLEALVVFTGGAGRIQAASTYLKNGFSGPVLVSGVYPGVKIETLFPETKSTDVSLDNVELDYNALSTVDNVAITTAWAKQNRLRKIGLITAFYHVPRSLLLFKRKEANLDVTPLPVFPSGAGVPTLLREYNKYLASLTNLI